MAVDSISMETCRLFTDLENVTLEKVLEIENLLDVYEKVIC